MKIQQLIYSVLIIISLSGCREKISYNIRTRNQSNEKLFRCKIVEFEKYIPSWSGTNLGTGGSAGPVTIPVPDKLTITWESVKPGKEKILERYEKELDRLWEKTQFPAVPDIKEPEGIYNQHKVVLVLKDKVPKRPKDGEIVITYLGNEKFDVKYVKGK